VTYAFQYPQITSVALYLNLTE